MLRKLSLVAVAAASLAGAALAPTSASAWGGHGWHGGWHGGGWGGPRVFVGGPAHYGYGYGGCYVRRLVPTPWGPRWRLINRCYLSESRVQTSNGPGPAATGAFADFSNQGTVPGIHSNFTKKTRDRWRNGNQSPLSDLVSR